MVLCGRRQSSIEHERFTNMNMNMKTEFEAFDVKHQCGIALTSIFNAEISSRKNGMNREKNWVRSSSPKHE